MERINRRIVASLLTTFTVLLLATLASVRADEPSPSATERNTASNDDAAPSPRRPNLLIIGASSLNSPVPQTQLVSAMLESNGTPMNVEAAYPRLDMVPELLRAKPNWDYVVMDAWHLGRSAADWGQGRAHVPADFPKALAAFVKQVRAHSPKAKIILFSWWIPSGPTATNEGVMEVFRSCAEHAKANDIWVATTGPAFMEAKLVRPNLRIVKSKTDGHPGNHGAYLLACSQFAIITDKSPVGLPATLSLTAADGQKRDFGLTPDDAKYLQELAWKVYQREVKHAKPAQSSQE
jgi:hypothetical protein